NTDNFPANHPTGDSPTHTYTTTGSKTITVSLTDEDGTHNSAGTKIITVDTPPATTLTVNKVLEPGTDGGLFNLQIDGSTAGTGANQGNGGTTGAVTVNAGNHTVGETAGTSTTLSDYTAVISGDCASDGTITLAAGDVKTCTITNTKK